MILNGKTIINAILYKYQCLEISDLLSFFKNLQDLKKSFETHIQSYKPHYTLKQLEKDANQSKIKKTYFFIVYNEDEIIFSQRFVFYVKSNFTYIDFIVTHPEKRGQHIGSQCLDLFLFKSRNVFNIYESKVRKDNIHALKCYQKNDFKIAKIIQQKTEKSTIDVCIMKKYNK